MPDNICSIGCQRHAPTSEPGARLEPAAQTAGRNSSNCARRRHAAGAGGPPEAAGEVAAPRPALRRSLDPIASLMTEAHHKIQYSGAPREHRIGRSSRLPGRASTCPSPHAPLERGLGGRAIAASGRPNARTPAMDRQGCRANDEGDRRGRPAAHSRETFQVLTARSPARAGDGPTATGQYAPVRLRTPEAATSHAGRWASGAEQQCAPGRRRTTRQRASRAAVGRRGRHSTSQGERRYDDQCSGRPNRYLDTVRSVAAAAQRHTPATARSPRAPRH